MGMLLNLVALPAAGPLQLILWLARTLAEESAREMLDEGRVRGELLELQGRYDAGQLGEKEYEHQESALLERLNLIRELKAGAASGDRG
ncbi:MAG: gas vesicle protein GvpG [Chloroflexi bacterium]|nr:gas vesicle protein GvpG [Chloroflexota bacterium]